jgi:hypothetical protein
VSTAVVRGRDRRADSDRTAPHAQARITPGSGGREDPFMCAPWTPVRARRCPAAAPGGACGPQLRVPKRAIGVGSRLVRLRPGRVARNPRTGRVVAPHRSDPSMGGQSRRRHGATLALPCATTIAAGPVPSIRLVISPAWSRRGWTPLPRTLCVGSWGAAVGPWPGPDPGGECREARRLEGTVSVS